MDAPEYLEKLISENGHCHGREKTRLTRRRDKAASGYKSQTRAHGSSHFHVTQPASMEALKKSSNAGGQGYSEAFEAGLELKMRRVDNRGYETRKLVFKYKAVFLNQKPIRLHI